VLKLARRAGFKWPKFRSQYVITAYKPSLDRWEGDYRTRKERP